MKSPFRKNEDADSAEIPEAKAETKAFDPTRGPHHVIKGPKAVKAFEYLTKVQRDQDYAARCRLWQMIHAEWPDTREGSWACAMGLVEVVVYRTDSPQVDPAKDGPVVTA